MSSPRPVTSRPVVLYFGVVCIGYTIDLVSYIGLVELGAHLYVAYLASFLVGASCNVLLLRKYFAASRYSVWKDLVLTFTSNGTILLLAMGIYVALMNLLGVPHLIAKIASNAVSFAMNYHIRRNYF